MAEQTLHNQTRERERERERGMRELMGSDKNKGSKSPNVTELIAADLQALGIRGSSLLHVVFMGSYEWPRR